MKPLKRKLLAAACALVSGLPSCLPAGEGIHPPEGEIYFPVGLVVDSESKYLYVVNSDFDLQYNQGTIFSLELSRVRDLTRVPCSEDSDCVDGGRCDTTPTEENSSAPSYTCVATSGEFAGRPCGFLPETTPSERALTPGRCGGIDLLEPGDGKRSLLRDSVGISAFATAGLLARSDTGQERLFVPVRGDSTVHYLDLDDGRFECGQDRDGVGGRCTLAIGEAPPWVQDIQPVPHENDRDQERDPLEVAPEPFDLAQSRDGRFLFLSHQVGGTISAFVNDWVGEPFLAAQITGLVESPMGVAVVPPPELVRHIDTPYRTAVVMSTRSEARIHLLRFIDDGILGPRPFDVPAVIQAADDNARPALRQVGSAPITVNSSGFDSRGVLIDDFERRRAEESCASGDVDCLLLAARVPLDVYVANRTPNSLLVGSTDWVDGAVPTVELPTFHNNIPLTAGPSRVVLGSVVTPTGQLERRVFVICFDSAIIYVYDPQERVVESEIRTGRGPHSLAFDTERPLLYVGHFTDSFVGVVSLDQRHPKSYGTMLGTIGIPTQPRAAK